MTEIDPELNAVLDAEYRQLVRSLHREAVEITIAVSTWFIDGAIFRVAVTASGGFNLSEEDIAIAENADPTWRELSRKLSVLINGHPDPDVREAADILDKRTFAAVMMVIHPKTGEKGASEEDKLAIKLIHDGMYELQRAVYHAPFRVHRPEPEWDGIPTGNREGMAHDILRRMKESGEHHKG